MWQLSIAHLLELADGPAAHFREPLLRLKAQMDIARKEDRGEDSGDMRQNNRVAYRLTFRFWYVHSKR